MSDLAAFLLARIAEDEQTARMAFGDDLGQAWHAVGSRVDDADGAEVAQAQMQDEAVHIARHDPARVLADCAAKRAIVERLSTCEREDHQHGTRARIYDEWWDKIESAGDDPDDVEFDRLHPPLPPRVTTPFETPGLRAAARLLASPFVAHPDFDPAWAVTT